MEQEADYCRGKNGNGKILPLPVTVTR
jgi:hypothetical protein